MLHLQRRLGSKTYRIQIFATLLFRDSSIAENFQLSRTKYGYILSHG